MLSVVSVGETVRCGLLEARAVARMLGVWPWVALLAWPVMVKLQEPDFFRRDGVPFYWASLQAILLVGSGTLPLALRFAHGSELPRWSQQVGRSAAQPSLSSWVGVVAYGTAFLVPILLWFYTVERILPGRAAPWMTALQTGGAAFGFLVMFASFSGLLTQMQAHTVTVVFCWSVLLILALQLFPFAETARDFSASERNSARILGILSTLCATLGGLAFSLAHGLLRHRRT